MKITNKAFKKAISVLLSLCLFASCIFCVSINAGAVSVHGALNEYGSLRAVNDDEFAQFERRVLDAWNSITTEVSITDFTISGDEIEEYYFGVLNNHPEYFYVKSILHYSLITITNKVTRIAIEYHFTKDELPERQAEFDSAVNDILDSLDHDMKDADKLLALHDTIALNCEYDTTVLTNPSQTLPLSYSSYGCLVDRLAVCQGYSYAYNYILGKLGIEAHFVNSPRMNHAWSMVKLDGRYYHIDLTWDDALVNLNDNYHDRLGYVMHRNFLQSDAEMTSSNHTSWDAPYTAGSSYPDSYWDQSVSAYSHIGDYQYFINALGRISKRNISTGEVEALMLIEPDSWNEQPDGYYSWYYSSARLVSDGVYLYFNRASQIYRFDVTNNTATSIYNARLVNSHISGLGFVGEDLKYDTIDASNNFIGRIDSGINASTDSPPPPTQTTAPTLPNTTAESTTTLTTEPIQTTNNGNGFMFGDCNTDEQINAKDLLMLKQHLASWSVPIDLRAADVNVDGNINAKDLLLIKQYLAGWPISLGGT